MDSKLSSRHLRTKKLYNILYNDIRDPLKIVQACQTRWFSITTTVDRIFNQWLKLKTHFNITKRQNCYGAEILYNMMIYNMMIQIFRS